MIRHSNSFIVSIFIHIVLFLLIYLSYKGITTGIKKEKTEPLLCMKLSYRCAPQVKVTPPVVEKKPQTKKEKPPVKITKTVKKIVLPLKKKKIIKQVKKVVVESKPVIKKTEIKKEVFKKIEKVKELKPKAVEVLKPEVAPEKEYIDDNIEKIIALLQENLYYPRRARKRGIQGEVIVRFTLSTEAKVSKIEVLSSNSAILSRGAVQTINNIDTKLPKPKQSITFNVPISYNLY